MVRVEVDIEDSVVDAMADVDAADNEVEDKVYLRRRCKTTTYLKLVGRLPHYLAAQQHHNMLRIPSNVTIIGIIVSHAASTWKMDIHLLHAHRIGENLGTRKDATDRTYSSKLRPDILH